ncbi:MAG TPA: protease complex subunit PrcB family protein [Kofleriaceae bacterium]|nr:protease complex subunit PrcB family protein [Kofleriaceae bacterium]
MKTRSHILLASLLSLGLAACAAESAPEGDLPIGDATGEDLGKADHTGLQLTKLDADVGTDRRTDGGRAILTSAASWESYLGTTAPADVDFSREWVAFYGSGVQNTGGHQASIFGVRTLSDGGLLIETEAVAPGAFCVVTQALTTPHTVVKFAIPSPRPTWAVADHHDRVQDCAGPDINLQAQLDHSRDLWDAAVAASGADYTYSQVFASFIGLSGETTFVVRDGAVVERSYLQTFGADVEQWTETGSDLGSHTDRGHAIALVDDLYAQCETEILPLDDGEHFMNLQFDDAGLLRVCTATHKLCNDDCDRGPKLGFIRFD